MFNAKKEKKKNQLPPPGYLEAVKHLCLLTAHCLSMTQLSQAFAWLWAVSGVLPVNTLSLPVFCQACEWYGLLLGVAGRAPFLSSMQDRLSSITYGGDSPFPWPQQ